MKNTATESVSFWVKPPAKPVKGQKYTLAVGAFYGPSVTYTFVAK